jgi:hypothetical protein
MGKISAGLQIHFYLYLLFFDKYFNQASQCFLSETKQPSAGCEKNFNELPSMNVEE